MEKRQILKLIETGDGSSSLELEGTDETYHSRHGAVTESNHVFIRHGIDSISSKAQISVFEMGFGTGLNALLAQEWAEENNVPVSMTSIEAFPLEAEIWKKLNYVDLNEANSKIWKSIHESPWAERTRISKNFELLKMHAKLEDWAPEIKTFDIVFYDAFGPKTQAELWELSALQKMHDSLKTKGVFVTYCAQGQFKRNLAQLGFKIESLPGPPGKREMTRAIKQ